VTPIFPALRFCYRFARGRQLEYGGRHQGRRDDLWHFRARWGCIGWVGGGLYVGFAVSWLVAQVYFWVTVFTLTALGGRWLVMRTRNAYLFRHDAKPLHQALFAEVGWPEEEAPWHWIHLPSNWRSDDGAEIRIDVKNDTIKDDRDKDKIAGIVGNTLGGRIDPSSAQWKLQGRKPHVILRVTYPLPSPALWADYRERVAQYTKPSVFVAGVGKYDKLITIDVDNESPMGLIAADPGSGKSQFLASAGAQFCHKGFVTVVFDPKEGSLLCLKGLPNVVYFGGARECFFGWLALKAEMERRKELLGKVEWQQSEHADWGAPLFVAVDESDAMTKYLRMEWDGGLRAEWEAVNGRTNTVPALNAMILCRAMGRQLEIFQWLVSQTGNDAALGGQGGRSMLAFRLIHGDEKLWLKTAGQKPPANLSGVKGRWHLIRHGAPVEVQTFKFEDGPPGRKEEWGDDARSWAETGTVAEIPELLKTPVTHVQRIVSEANEIGFDTVSDGGVVTRRRVAVTQPVTQPRLRLVPSGQSLGAFIAGQPEGPATIRVPRPEGDRLVTLKEAAAADWGQGLSLNAWRTASGREGFPARRGDGRRSEAGPPQNEYFESELRAWHEARMERLG
jgi:hypothetical protein